MKFNKFNLGTNKFEGGPDDIKEGKSALDSSISKTPHIGQWENKQREELNNPKDNFKEFFNEINPEGIPIDELRDRLTFDIEELKKEIEKINIEHRQKSVSIREHHKIIDPMTEELKEKESWVARIDNFLSMEIVESKMEDKYNIKNPELN